MKWITDPVSTYNSEANQIVPGNILRTVKKGLWRAYKLLEIKTRLSAMIFGDQLLC